MANVQFSDLFKVILTNYARQLTLLLTLLSLIAVSNSCGQTQSPMEMTAELPVATAKPEYFSLRPEVEKGFGYTSAVKIGNHIKISGAVSMDAVGNPTAIGDLEQQMKNCYASLEKILSHYGCTFDDVVVENIFTTNMPLFLEAAAYRRTIYQQQFPTGTWLGVKELALPVFLIEIEMEAYKGE